MSGSERSPYILFEGGGRGVFGVKEFWVKLTRYTVHNVGH